MFKSRSGSQGSPTTLPPQSIEAVRRRARHRLIGASVLVLIGVVGFPFLFDTQPRPISVDIPIEIPAKNATPPLVLQKKASTEPAPPSQPVAPVASATASTVSSAESLSAREEVVATSPVAATSASAKTEPQPRSETRAAAKAAPETVPADGVPSRNTGIATAEANRVKALLDGKTGVAPVAGGARIVVQVGAFADAARAREVRAKLEAAGLKTYTHVAQTSDGSRIRVRVGPFATRAEAEKAASRVKGLGLPVAILTL